MVAFKNFLGGTMYVDESRVEHYLSLGYVRETTPTEEVTHTKSEEKVDTPKVEKKPEEKPKKVASKTVVKKKK